MNDEAQTLELGNILGKNLRGGEVIELIGDLGGGKTTLTRGIVAGTGSKDHVNSPTFTISNIYHAQKYSIYHFDFYRIGEAGLIEHELEEVLSNHKAVILIEWSDVVKHVLPENHVTIHCVITHDEGREFTIHYPKKFAYLMKGIQ